mmetsp:Transcript_2715/g.4044  ORF Transcript_2715/g.4044 Transcript_2715/m.4044 type:complete len:82 (-) Transcript_2715:466-711(-)
MTEHPLTKKRKNTKKGIGQPVAKGEDAAATETTEGMKCRREEREGDLHHAAEIAPEAGAGPTGVNRVTTTGAATTQDLAPG